LDGFVCSRRQDAVVVGGDNAHLDVISVVEVPTHCSIEWFKGGIEEDLERPFFGGLGTEEISPGLGDRKGH
jgi:hypothetical protein